MKKLFLLLILISPSTMVLSQNQPTEKIYHLSGSIWATNNGISLIPSFNLGEPAVMFNFSVGGKKLSFDPQFRFSMEGKPWSFIFWWRYRFIQNEKFQFQIGAHPAYSFKEIDIIKDGKEMEILRVRRYLAVEVSPTFKLSNKISIKPYYLYAYGVESDITQNTQYVALQSSFSNLMLTKNLNFSFYPQVYYLRMDGKDGFYVASSFFLAFKNFPVAASFMFNQKIESEIASKDFIWSVSLVYSFRNNFKKK